MGEFIMQVIVVLGTVGLIVVIATILLTVIGFVGSFFENIKRKRTEKIRNQVELEIANRLDSAQYWLVSDDRKQSQLIVEHIAKVLRSRGSWGISGEKLREITDNTVTRISCEAVNETVSDAITDTV